MVNKTYEDGTEYTGKWKDGLPHGYGKLTHPNGTIYKGHFVDGDRHGSGSFESKTESYIGEFKYDVYHGEGTLKIKDQFEYKGSFKNGLFHGHGYLHLIDNIIYDGEWIQGKKDGFGELKVIIGSETINEQDKNFYETYKGEFKNDQFNGFGTYQHSDGSIYEGMFENNIRKGQGKLTLFDGTVYEGEFDNENLTGKDGTKYKLGGKK